MVLIQPLTGEQGTRSQRSASSSGRTRSNRIIQPIMSADKPILAFGSLDERRGASVPPSGPNILGTANQPESKSLFEKIGDFILEKVDPLVPGGVQAGVERVKAAPLSEFFLPTASGRAPEAVRKYVKETAKSALKTVKGIGKSTPPYIIYRAMSGVPVSQEEYVNNLLETGLEGLTTLWRVNPAAPVVGAALGTIKDLRKRIQKGENISWDNISTSLDAAISGVNTQPGVGETLTDNVKLAQAIDTIFLVSMAGKGFAGKKLNTLTKRANIRANEINRVSKTLGVKPTATMNQVNKAMRREIRKVPDAFTANPSTKSLARRKEITEAFNTLKRAGVVDKTYARAWGFLEKASPTGSKKPPKIAGELTAKVGQKTPPSSISIQPKAPVPKLKPKKPLKQPVKPVKTVQPPKKDLISLQKTKIKTPDPVKQKGTILYRGDSVKTSLKQRSTVDSFDPTKRESLSSFNNTPGLYFTTSVDDAKSYGENIMSVSVGKKANLLNINDAHKKINRLDVEKIIRSNPNIKDWAPNWDEDFDKAISNMVDTVMDEKDGNEFLKSIWSDGGFSPKDFADSMKKFGIDGVYIKKGKNTHYVIYNKNILREELPEKPVVKPKKKIITVPRQQVPVGEGQVKASRLEARVKDVLDKAPKEAREKLGVSTFQQMNKKDNIRKATEYATANPDDAIEVLKGNKEVPKGILKNSLYVAMQNNAIGDVDLARKLASIQSTRFGQEISVLTEIDKDSPVGAMREIVQVRRKAFEQRFKGKTVKQAQKKIASEINRKIKQPTNRDWNRFIKSIEC